MNFDRRGFFSFTLAGVASACLAPFLPKRNPAPGLKFHKDAFAMMMAPLKDGDAIFYDEETGISVRFVKAWEPVPIDLDKQFGVDFDWSGMPDNPFNWKVK